MTGGKGSPQVVILAGGLGTRLRPLTETVPKPLVPVAGQSFLSWQLQDVRRQGLTRILILVSYLGEKIVEEFSDGEAMGLQISYAFESEPLGTGGALRNAYDLLDEEFVLLNGDSFLRAPLKLMHDSFLRLRAAGGGIDAMVSTYDNHQPVPVIPNLKVASGRVSAYMKNGGSDAGFHLIDSGVYLLTKNILAVRSSGEKFQLEDLWPNLVSRKALGAFNVGERFYDIGTVERLKEFEEKLHDYFPNSISR